MNDETDVRDLWLAAFVVASDILIMDVIETIPKTQEAIGRVRHCYTAIYADVAQYDTGFVRFVTGTPTWGNANPEKGEVVLIAIGHSAIEGDVGRMYEKHWHGHFGVQEVNGQFYAIAKYQIKGIPRVPPHIRDAVLPVPGAPNYSAFPLAMLEDYLMEIIPKINKVQPTRSPLGKSGSLLIS